MKIGIVGAPNDILLRILNEIIQYQKNNKSFKAADIQKNLKINKRKVRARLHLLVKKQILEKSGPNYFSKLEI